MTTTIKDGITTVEEEKKIGECDEGSLIGEIALIDPEKSTRLLSALVKTDCVFLLLN
jgi:hypothetical protein